MRAPKCAATCSGECSFSPGATGVRSRREPISNAARSEQIFAGPSPRTARSSAVPARARASSEPKRSSSACASRSAPLPGALRTDPVPQRRRRPPSSSGNRGARVARRHGSAEILYRTVCTSWLPLRSKSCDTAARAAGLQVFRRWKDSSRFHSACFFGQARFRFKCSKMFSGSRPQTKCPAFAHPRKVGRECAQAPLGKRLGAEPL